MLFLQENEQAGITDTANLYPANMPVFLMTPSDEFAVPAMQSYVDSLKAASEPTVDADYIAACEQWIKNMQVWQQANGTNTPKLSAAAQQERNGTAVAPATPVKETVIGKIEGGLNELVDKVKDAVEHPIEALESRCCIGMPCVFVDRNANEWPAFITADAGNGVAHLTYISGTALQMASLISHQSKVDDGEMHWKHINLLTEAL